MRLLVASAFGYAAPAAAAVVVAWMSVSAYGPTVVHHAAYAAWALALLGVSSTVPTLAVAFVSGTLADRMDRRTLLRAANALGMVSALLLIGVFWVFPTHRYAVPGPAGFFVPEWFLWMLPVWALLAIAAALSRPTLNSAVPQVVASDALSQANGVILSASLLASGVGTLSVGILLGPIGPVLTLFLPLAFFETAAVALFTLESDVTGSRRPSQRSFASDMVAGLRYVGSRTGLLEITLASLGVNFFVAVAWVELPLFVHNWLAQGAFVLGALTFVSSLGMAVGASAVNTFRYDRAPGVYLAVFVVLIGLSLLILPFTHSTYVAVFAVGVFGLLLGMVTTIYLVVIQRAVPNELLGRVFAADEIGSFALVPLGQSVGGAITAIRGLAFAYWSTGGGIAVMGAVMSGLRDLRDFAAGRDRIARPTETG